MTNTDSIMDITHTANDGSLKGRFIRLNNNKSIKKIDLKDYLQIDWV